jgi:amidohydrolase
MAAADIFTIKIIGNGGHGAAPHLSNDPILATSQIINLVQSVVSRNVPPLKSAVVTIASIHGGDAFNVIPAEVVLKGTIRTFETEIRDVVIRRLHQILENTAKALGCRAEIDIQSITPAVVNDAAVTARVQQVAKSLFANTAFESQYMTMGSEDMAFVLQKIPGCFCFIGSANKSKNLDAPHHSSKFDIDENIFPSAVGLMAGSIMELVNR